MIDWIQPGAAPVADDGVDKGVRCRLILEAFDLGTEVMRVRLYSVVAAVDLADHYGEHLPLLP